MADFSSFFGRPAQALRGAARSPALLRLAVARGGLHPRPVPKGKKLRAAPPSDPFHVVLVEPEIPPNTGAVARTCAATGSVLHLIEPLGFRTDQQAVRRAGLDYWPLVRLHQHASWERFRAAHPGRKLHFFTAGASRSYLEADLAPGDGLVFGRESVGLPRELLEAHPKRTWAIPTLGPVRSLNLSNAVAIVVYEGLRGAGFLAETFVEEGEVP